MPPPLLHVVAPVHHAVANASIEVMINCFVAQTSRDWALTIVSDGPDARAADVVGRHAAADARVRYAETDRAYADHGHTPRERGLFEGGDDARWTVLTGVGPPARRPNFGARARPGADRLRFRARIAAGMPNTQEGHSVSPGVETSPPPPPRRWTTTTCRCSWRRSRTRSGGGRTRASSTSTFYSI